MQEMTSGQCNRPFTEISLGILSTAHVVFGHVMAEKINPQLFIKVLI